MTRRASEQLPLPETDEGAVERPVRSGGNAAGFGSDAVAETLRALDIPYIAVNPGASYRGLHDSLVNHLGNAQPQMLLCLHEETAVAIAHGWAKVTGRAMAAAVHSNVGLFHATMAIFNAWCDRMPVLVIGATGPVDAMKRRPWIDWIHTARDQGAIVRHYTKWDDQPASAGAACESIVRANWIANTVPQGPTYVVLDAEMQEAKLQAPIAIPDVARLAPPVAGGVSPAVLDEALRLIKAAKAPVILAGRASRRIEAWNARVGLAEAIKARVLTDIKVGASFPTDHPLHAGDPVMLVPGGEAANVLANADLVISFDWVDLGGALHSAGVKPSAKVIQITADQQIHNGWSMDYQALAPVDLFIGCDPDETAIALAKAMAAKPAARLQPRAPAILPPEDKSLSVEHLAMGLRRALGEREVALTHLPLSWNGGWWPLRHPLDFLGSDGGGGIGGGPGISVGAALALKGSGRMPVAICGDGDFLMGNTAIWTAVHYRIPILFVIANNRSFFNDELHQERVARMRDRPVENRWIGQRMADPEIDIAEMAHAQGAKGFGPVRTLGEMEEAFMQAIAAVEAGEVAVVDVRVEPGYAAATTNVMLRKSAE
ncbi:thiamine pyrophosphate-binding protein [Pseudolabrys sp. Root1462]|uniref:thiamine pyrophosphate-binding protein n=1 Tax=Pseudolabrys sp. Root1462 TaxID=1736466 RepID=UPI000B21BB37|nr:thiamine pyrophosphate-binding protein [Pseudolabrys sp. Root1462]